MKKISFGSFPLTEMRPDDRKCLDRYLIKTFADNISISDAIRNLAITKNLMYITPDSLMKTWLDTKGEFFNKKNSGNINVSDRSSSSTYDAALKRAFYVLKEFYKKIQHAPFYKEYIYYPIYVEKTDKVMLDGEGHSAHAEVQMNYSFVILSNDLTKSLKINEIRYDENASLNFLYLFVEFFSNMELNGTRYGKSIHDFKQEDYEFLVKLYQFIEQSGKDPIQMTLDLYKLLGLVNQASSGKTSGFEMGQKAIDMGDDFSAKNLSKYKGIIKHHLQDIVRTTNGRSSVTPEVQRESFTKLMNAIFKSEQLSGLFEKVDAGADLGARYRYVYNTNKYREVLNLAKELVEYNKLGINQVVSTDPMDFDFKVEHGEYRTETQSQIVAQKYQTFFKTYVESIKTYIENIIKVILDDLNITSTVNREVQNQLQVHTREIADLRRERDRREASRDQAEADRNQFHADAKTYRASGDHQQSLDANRDAARRESDMLNHAARIAQIDTEIQQREVMSSLTAKAGSEADRTLDQAGNEIYKEIAANILGAIANDLTFIYDDGKRFFMNELVTKGFLESISPNATDKILTPDGFQHIADNRYNYKEDLPDYAGPNPIFYMAEVVGALQDGFDVMADDTIVAIQDNIMPAVQRMIRNNASALSTDVGNNNNNPFWKDSSSNATIVDKVLKDLFARIQAPNFIPDTTRKNLSKEVYRNRFITNILTNFSKMFRSTKIDKVLAFDQSVSQLHPLIKKMLKDGPEGQFFKSFVIKYETCEQLYNTKFLVDTQKFLYGLTDELPRKMTNPMNKLQVVIESYLGLKNNPTWVIGKTDLFLSMPDGLSLTNTSLLSKIPKTELMDVCKIKASDYWNENTMGKVTEFGSPKIRKLRNEISELRKKIQEAYGNIKRDNNKSDKSDKSNKDDKDNKGNPKPGNKKKGNNVAGIVAGYEKQIAAKEEQISKLKLEEKPYKPNAFLFAEEPEMAENQPLLSDAEKADLEKGKQDMLTQIHKLNNEDDSEIEAMMGNAKAQTMRDNPFDTMDPTEDKGQNAENAENAYDDNDESSVDKFLRNREERRQEPEDDDEALRRLLKGNRS